jgi:hypothetical protein
VYWWSNTKIGSERSFRAEIEGTGDASGAAGLWKIDVPAISIILVRQNLHVKRRKEVMAEDTSQSLSSG